MIIWYYILKLSKLTDILSFNIEMTVPKAGSGYFGYRISKHDGKTKISYHEMALGEAEEVRIKTRLGKDFVEISFGDDTIRVKKSEMADSGGGHYDRTTGSSSRPGPRSLLWDWR